MMMSSLPPVPFLIVDDRPENLLSLEALLRRDGLQFLKANSGVEALELLLQHEVALALLDVQMPEMDGFELAETMRGNERTRRIPIIFLTAGIGDRNRRFRGYEAGAVDYLEKPLEPDALRSKCDVFFELFRQRQQIAAQRDRLAATAEENSRLLKESRRYAAALKEADQRKDEFLATLAHELRNPLAPLSNSLSLLASGKAPLRVRDQALGLMDRQVKQMVRLVDDLMDVARITRGKIVLKRQRVELSDVLRSAVEISQPLIEEFNHTLVTDFPAQPVWFDADLTRLAQIFSNLLNNAAKYSEPGKEIRFSAEVADGFATVRIRDQGIGMAPETMARIFDMFAQADQSLERAYGGLGVGLTLVKALVEMHGGTISAWSGGVGKGSEFAVRLPLVEDTTVTEEQSETRNADAPAGGLRIMIVEDNEALAQTTGWMVEMIGHDYKIAHNAQEAMALSKDYLPDVIMMDIGLPGMNGYDLCAAMKPESHLKNTVFVAQTGWGQDEHRQRARDAGFDHHLVKPVYLELLQEVLGDIEKQREGA
jgi:signal transduction histidine kinase